MVISHITRPLPGLRSRPRKLRRQLPSHVFASHHLRACSALPCSCLEPSALGVRRRSVLFPPAKTKALSRPCLRFAYASLRHRLSGSLGRVTPLASRSLFQIAPTRPGRVDRQPSACSCLEANSSHYRCGFRIRNGRKDRLEK